MAYGLPIITTYASRAPITDGVEGMSVYPRDPESLKKALRYFHDKPEEITRMGNNGRKKAESMTWEKFGYGVVEVLEDAGRK